MKFEDSGLPQEQIIEDAFNHSYANVMAGRAEALNEFAQQITLSYREEMELLVSEKQAGTIKEEQFEVEKKMLEKSYKDQLKVGPRIIEKELESMFEQRRVGPALEILQNSSNSSPQLLAAVMLIDCVRSPIDFQNIVKKFGEGIAGVIADVHHIDAYPSEKEINMAKAGGDTKRAYMALLITSLNQIVLKSEKMAKAKMAQKIVFPPGQEESLFGNAKIFWENDRKLAERFLTAFNRAAEVASSPFRMEVSTEGALDLVKGSQPPKKPTPKIPKGPTPPAGPGGPGSGTLGDDLF